LKAQDELILFAREALGLSSSVATELLPLSGRGSDRAYYRFKWAQDNSAILVHYNPNRIENTYFADIAAFLTDNNIPVPRIICNDAAGCCLAMEDLGDIDLWSFRNAPWEIRRSLYQKALVAAHRLHSIPESQFPAGRVKLMESFGPAYYQWERNYFRDNYVKAYCGIQLEPDFAQQLETELSSLAERLTSGKLHRDLQSQNIMICRNEPYLIDFQGMRFGSPFYDLGSLLCDPYVTLAGGERLELLTFYYNLSDTKAAWQDFQNTYWEATAQRLMQALGAYGFLGFTKGLKSYLLHVPAGLRNLQMAAENATALPALQALCARLQGLDIGLVE
jgi:N-acetylmuramate 1-kinase